MGKENPGPKLETSPITMFLGTSRTVISHKGILALFPPSFALHGRLLTFLSIFYRPVLSRHSSAQSGVPTMVTSQLVMTSYKDAREDNSNHGRREKKKESAGTARNI